MVAIARCAAFVATAPPSMRAIPPSVRAALALTLSPLVASKVEHIDGCCSAASIVAGGALQAIGGAALGLSAQIVAGAAVAAGSLVDSAMSQPPAGIEREFGGASGPVARVYSLAFAFVFLGTGGFARLVGALSLYAPGVSVTWTVDSVASLGRACIAAAISIAWPALCASFLATIAAGVLGRLSPRVNVMFLSAPLATVLVLAVLMAGSPVLLEHLTSLAATTISATALKPK